MSPFFLSGLISSFIGIIYRGLINFLLSECMAVVYRLPKCLTACSQDGFIKPHQSRRPLHVPD